MIIVFEFIILIALLVCYKFAPEQISAEYLTVVISLALLSYILLWCEERIKLMFREHFLSNITLFTLCFCIICFQFPIDYILDNKDINFSNYFYSFHTINLSTTFNAICLVSFNIGVLHKSLKLNSIKKRLEWEDITIIPTRPLYLIMLSCWFGFISFINMAYINGGHGTVAANPISLSFYGYFCRFNIIFLAISLHKILNRREKLSLLSSILSLPKVYWFIILTSALLFYFANNRVYTFYILFPALFYLLSVTKIKTKPLISLLIIIIVGVFFTLFKIYGIDRMFTEGTIDVSSLSHYDRFSSFSPFTSELAGSIWADSALFYIWYNRGIVIMGSTLVLGVLRTISGTTPIFFAITGLSEKAYSSASFVTDELSAGYGLGSSVSGDLIVSVGFYGALIVMYFLGRVCFVGDSSLFNKLYTFKGLLVGICVSSQIVFVTRSSLCDLISILLFCLIFSSIYIKYYQNKSYHNRSIS